MLSCTSTARMTQPVGRRNSDTQTTTTKRVYPYDPTGTQDSTVTDRTTISDSLPTADHTYPPYQDGK